jgi:hypothetical protein
MQIGKDLNEALDGLLAGIDSLLADRDLKAGEGSFHATDEQTSGPRGASAWSDPSAGGPGRPTVSSDIAVLSALALACQSQAIGRDAQQTYRALLRKALQDRALGGQEPQADHLRDLVRLPQPMSLSPRWVHWLSQLGRPGRLQPLTADTMRFVLDEPLDADDWAALSTTGPLSVLVQASNTVAAAEPADLMVRELDLPVWPEIQAIPPGCQLDDVMPMAELDQQSPCLIYWLDHWLPSHPMVLGLALPLRPMPALTDLSWAALVRSTGS